MNNSSTRRRQVWRKDIMSAQVIIGLVNFFRGDTAPWIGLEKMGGICGWLMFLYGCFRK